MSTNFSGISSYQQTNQAWANNSASKSATTPAKENKTPSTANNNVKVSEWKGVNSSKSSLIPTKSDDYGTVVGDAKLSDTAKNYYDKLKQKFHGMDFILVSKDMKDQVKANTSLYGNSSKPVVLIDEEEIERMATDENFRKKYEGIIESSQAKLLEAKNSLLSSGANVKNFGMSVDSDGRASFFATIEKSNKEQAKRLEKRQAEKKAEKAKAKKAADKELKEKLIEKRKENSKAEDISKDNLEADENDIFSDDKEYLEFKSDSLEDLISAISDYAFKFSANNVLTESESMLGQNIDFKG